MGSIKTLFFLGIFLFKLGLFANDSDVLLTKGSFADEEWRDEHQWKGRNEGGWRHSNWYGGVNTPEENQEMNSWYFGEYDRAWLPPPTIRIIIEGEEKQENQEEKLDGEGYNDQQTDEVIDESYP